MPAGACGRPDGGASGEPRGERAHPIVDPLDPDRVLPVGILSAETHGILLARVPRSEVDDLAQDIFLHAFRKLHTLRDLGAFGPWIAMITRNRAMDFYRRSRETVANSSENPRIEPK